MFPQGFGANWHMEYLAKSNNIHHTKWTNAKKEDANTKSSHLPPKKVTELLSEQMRIICPKKT